MGGGGLSSGKGGRERGGRPLSPAEPEVLAWEMEPGLGPPAGPAPLGPAAAAPRRAPGRRARAWFAGTAGVKGRWEGVSGGAGLRRPRPSSYGGAVPNREGPAGG